MPRFDINIDPDFRDSLCRAIIIESQPDYDGNTLGWHYADPIQGQVWRWVPERQKPWSDDVWSIADVCALADLDDLDLDLAGTD